jgi:predicted NBD/HSP70 family sugar kinase
MDRPPRGPGPAGADDGARHAKHLRDLNLQRVLAVAMDRGSSLTRAELTEATGLSAPTVGTLTSELIRLGVIVDRGPGPSSGGRRPSRMEFNARYGYVAAIDLGPARTRLAVADLRGRPIGHRTLATPSALAARELLAHAARELRRLAKESGASPSRLLAVGAAVPGVVDAERDAVGMAPHLRGWSAVPMRQLLRRALGAGVIVENDVNLALLGEHWRGAARGHRTCAFVFAGAGIGAAILIDGHLHRGHHSMAGEIAMMYMGPQYVGTDFGSQGCLEALAGVEALAARWGGARGGDPLRSVGELMSAAQRGERRARRVVEETARLIAMAVANVATVVDPSVVVLGGELLAHAEPLFDQVRRTVARIARTPVEVVRSALGDEAALHGALLLASREARRRLRMLLANGGGPGRAARSRKGT